MGRLLLLTTLSASATGCLAAAAAGAASGIYLTTRGVESLVDGTVDDVAPRAQAAFRDLGIRETGTSTDRGGDEREFRGTRDDLEVTVKLTRESPTATKAEVSARRNLAEWDKDFARQVLQRLVAKP